MQGTLDTFSVVEILQMLGKARRSGTLHIECPNRQIDVHFVAGRIAETRDSTRVFTDTVLGSQLLKRSLVNEAQLNDALTVQERQPRPLGTLLVEGRHLHERDLREVLSRQIANTLVAVKVETSGTFVFVADPGAGPVDFITVDTHAVLMDISSLGGDYCLAIEVLGQANTVLVRNRDYESLPRHSMTMGRDELYILAQVDDHRTVREIASATSLEEITVVSVLGMLAEAGVVLVKAEKQTRAEADVELKAHRDSVWAEVSSLLDGLSAQSFAETPAEALVPGQAPEAAHGSEAGQPAVSGAPFEPAAQPGAPSEPAAQPGAPSEPAAQPGISPEPLSGEGGVSSDEIDWSKLVPE